MRVADLTDQVVLVVAPNRQQFVHWCHEQQVSPLDQRVRCVREQHHLRGWSRDKVFLHWLGAPQLNRGEAYDLIHAWDWLLANGYRRWEHGR